MSIFLVFVFIFFIGSSFGWLLELIFRRFVHRKWINPGFLVGPYLPIYGFSLCLLTGTYFYFDQKSFSAFFIILFMGISMTLIELIGGLLFQKFGIKLWDYSNQVGNYKGVVCPLFSIIWTFLSGIYYYFIVPYLIHALEWFSKNLSFSFVLGIFFGIIIIDFIYSTKLLFKIREFSRKYHLQIQYEEFKRYIKKFQLEKKEKYSFLFAFQTKKSIHEYLKKYHHHKGKKL